MAIGVRAASVAAAMTTTTRRARMPVLVRRVPRARLWTDGPVGGVRLDASSNHVGTCGGHMRRSADPVGHVVDIVEAGLDDLVEEMMAAYRAALPAYHDAPP